MFDVESAPKTDPTVEKEEEVKIERPPAGPEISESSSFEDGNLVTWDGPLDPMNPKNWSRGKRWAITSFVSSYSFISPVTSSTIAPALTAIASDFHVTDTVEKSLMLSIFVLAYAIGPLFLGPLSEIYGRVYILQLSNLFFLVFNIACGFAQSKSQMFAFRFLSGLGGSAPLSIGAGVITDCWTAADRGKATGIYALGPLLGPAIGPLVGGWIVEKSTWRWAFWATSIFDGVIQILSLAILDETYAPTILRKKVKKLIKSTGNKDLHTEYKTLDAPLLSLIGTNFLRPLKMLGTQPLVQVLGVYMAFLYGLIYLIISTFPNVWGIRYGESTGIGGLNYLSLGLGFIFGSTTTSYLSDTIYQHLRGRNSNTGVPEYRIPLMAPASILVPVGLVWYAWCAQYTLHWILPNIGAFIFGYGAIMAFQCIQTYVVDAYTRYAASALGAVAVLRSLAGFSFPLFAPLLYEKLGYGWGGTLLAGLAIVLGLPGPFLMYKYGVTLRKKSPFAAG